MDPVTDCVRSPETANSGTERIPPPGVEITYLRPEPEWPYVTIGIVAGSHLGESVVGPPAIPQPNQPLDLGANWETLS